MIRTLLLLSIPAAALAIAACGNETPGTDTPVTTENGSDAGADVASYEQAMDAQRELVREITTVLERVTDEESAADAAPRIEALSGELQRLAVRINAMPQLPYAEQQRISQERAGSTAARREAGKQMLKIERYPVLKEAWSRGMRSVGD